MNTTEKLQSFIRNFINRIIKDDFKDIDDIPIENLDFNIPRQSLKLICLHDDKDSLLHTLVRLLIYGIFIYIPTLINDGYYIPYFWLQENYNFIPQIVFYFKDNPENRVNRKKPLEAEISIRLPFLDTSQTTAKKELELISRKILLEFRNFRFTKGRIKYSYIDKQNKINMSCFVSNKSDAIELFKSVLNCIDLIYDDDNITEHKPEKSFNIPEKRKVFGKTYEIERRRIGVVEFEKATLHIAGIKPICLVKKLKGVLINQDIDDYIQSFYS
jgi:hypothetical protein